MDPTSASVIEEYNSGRLKPGDPASAGYAGVTDLPTGASTQPSAEIPGPDVVMAALPSLSAKPNSELLSQIKPIHTAPVPGSAPAARDGVTRNDLGEPMTLDAQAQEACGNAEIAVRSWDSQDLATVTKHAEAAAAAAKASSIAGIRAWSEQLSAVVPDSGQAGTLVGFLSACTAGGYEL